MNNSFKKTILIDLDGVLNTYKGDFNAENIPPINEGAYEFIKKLSETYKIKIFTSRNLFLVSKWIIKNNLDRYIYDVTNHKEPCYLIVDDRCINFDGNYQKTLNHIEYFKTWYMVNNN